MVRVIAGTARGRRLVAPDGVEVRPTGDRVREAMFNALGSLGALEGAVVLDLFAGSGALGIEALSRGAAEVTFVDRSARALEAVRANLAALDLEGQARLVRSDALEHLAVARPRVDLALLDPPYSWAAWDKLWGGLSAAVVVAESDRPVEVPEGYVVQRQRRYGGTVVTIARSQDRDEHGRTETEDRS